MKVRYFSMFTGIGGGELGIEAAANIAGAETECVGYSEIDGYCLEVFERHFPNYVNFGDATKLDPDKLPDFDLLIAGFPCQSFSSAGSRNGFNDVRGTLFHDVARVLENKRPRHFILENVAGLLSIDNGQTFQTIVGVLTGLGYCVEWQLIDSANHGVAQSRPRLYFVGHLGGLPRRPVFPLSGEVAVDVSKRPSRGRYGERVFDKALLETQERGRPFGVTRRKGDEENTHVYREREIATVVDASYYKGLDVRNSRTAVAVLEDDEMLVRMLTPLECERLQGFPDGWTAGVPDKARYSQLGNAMTVPVMRDIAIELFSLMRE